MVLTLTWQDANMRAEAAAERFLGMIRNFNEEFPDPDGKELLRPIDETLRSEYKQMFMSLLWDHYELDANSVPDARPYADEEGSDTARKVTGEPANAVSRGGVGGPIGAAAGAAIGGGSAGVDDNVEEDIEGIEPTNYNIGTTGPGYTGGTDTSGSGTTGTNRSRY